MSDDVVQEAQRVGLQTQLHISGKYDALNEEARYAEKGLWCSADIRFSVHGPLSNTIAQLIRMSNDGHFAKVA